MTDIVDLEEYKLGRQLANHEDQLAKQDDELAELKRELRQLGPWAIPGPLSIAANDADAPNGRPPPAAPSKCRAETRPRRRRVSRAEVARIARALGAGLAAFKEASCVSIDRTMAYAEELEAWGMSASTPVPASARRYQELSLSMAGECGCASEAECVHSDDPGSELSERFYGEHDMESKICDLMRIVAGGANPGESPRDLLDSFGHGFCDSGLGGVVADAVDASLARDAAQRKRARRRRERA